MFINCPSGSATIHAFKLISLQGLLRDESISARGGLLVSGANLVFESLEVRTDEAVLELNGALAVAGAG